MASHKKDKWEWFLLLLSIIAFVTLKTPCADAAPQWLQAYHSGSLQPGNIYYGIGYADFKGDEPGYESQRLAKDRALDELCYQLSVTVRSELTDAITQKGEYTDEQVASSLFVGTRNHLSGVNEKHQYSDIDKGRHWTMVVIDKTSADRQVKEQRFINELVERLERKQDEILSGVKKMAAVIERQAQLNETRLKHFEQLLNTVGQKMEAAGHKTLADYSNIRSDLDRISEQQSRLMNNQQVKMDALIRQNTVLLEKLSTLSERIGKDAFMALTQEDLQRKNDNRQFSVNITPLKGQGADYYDGEVIQFRVTATHDCYIKVIYVSSTNGSGNGEAHMNTLLFPNHHDRNNFLRAGQSLLIGSRNELVVEPPYGKDVVTVVAAQQQFDDMESMMHRTRGGYYSERTSNIQDLLQVRTRGIGVMDTPETGASYSSDVVASDTCFIVSHARNKQVN